MGYSDPQGLLSALERDGDLAWVSTPVDRTSRSPGQGRKARPNNARIWAIVGIVIKVLGLLSVITENATY